MTSSPSSNRRLLQTSARPGQPLLPRATLDDTAEKRCLFPPMKSTFRGGGTLVKSVRRRHCFRNSATEARDEKKVGNIHILRFSSQVEAQPESVVWKEKLSFEQHTRRKRGKSPFRRGTGCFRFPRRPSVRGGLGPPASHVGVWARRVWRLNGLVGAGILADAEHTCKGEIKTHF